MRAALGIAGAIVALVAPVASAQGTAQLVGKASCRPNDRPEPGLQGQVPVAERYNGNAAAGYNCNLTQIGAHGSLAHDPSHSRLTGWANFDTYEHCAYFHDGNDVRGQGGGTVVLDVSDPANPKQTAYLQTPAMRGAWESLRVNQRRGLLVADHQNSTGASGDAGGTSPLDVYDVSQDCAHPKLLFSGTLPNIEGHEGWFQPDGTIYYVSGGSRLVPVDLSDPTKPKELGVFTDAAHGGSTSDDGTRGYHCTGSSVTIYDTSEIAARRPNPKLTEISQVELPGTQACQETYPVTYGQKKYLIQFGELGEFSALGGTPCGQIRYSNFSRPNIIDITDEREPKLVTTLMNEVALPQNCRAIAGDTAPLTNPNTALVSVIFIYGTHMCHPDRLHEPTILACAEFYSGVRVYDIRDPLKVREIAYFNAGSLSPSDPALDQAPARPVIRPDLGQIWVNTQSEGFHVLKFAEGVYPFPETRQCPRTWDWFVAHYDLACRSITPGAPSAAPAKRCVTSLRLRIRDVLGRRRARGVSRATVYVNGRRARALRGARLRRAFRLRGLRGTTASVRVVAKTRHGRTVRRTRSFALCT